MAQMGLIYQTKKMKAAAHWSYMGSRQGNFENSFVLPSYSRTDIEMGYQVSQLVDVSLSVHNVFNQIGLNNFFGPNQFGSNSNAASAAFIASNPNASFVVFPTRPRAITIGVTINI